MFQIYLTPSISHTCPRDPDGKQDKDGKVVEYVTYEVVEGQAEVVRQVFEMRAYGRSYREVAHTLNEEGSMAGDPEVSRKESTASGSKARVYL